MSESVIIYTDGACSGNPGRGGYGAILTMGSYEREILGGFRKTTNNRMELLAIICGLESLKKRCDVTIVSDSKYIIDAMNKKWAHKWARNNWMRNKKESAKNPDLWERMLNIETEHNITFKWVKGHSGHTMNERADQLAVKARDDEASHETDLFYEKNRH